MELEIRLYAGLKCNQEKLPCYGKNEFNLEVSEDITLQDLHDMLGLGEFKYKLVYLVNGVAKPLDWKLEDKDRVGIFPPVGGG